MIDITVSGRLELRNVPSKDERAIREALTFKNPKYEELGRLGKFRRHVPTHICHVGEVGGALSIPRGVDLSSVIGDVRWSVTDNAVRRPHTQDLECAFDLRPYQQRCVDAALTCDQGYIVAPTGSGKTIIGLALIAARKQRVVILVHTTELLRQWTSAIRKFLGVDAGRIGGGADTRSQITVAMIQTISRRGISLDDIGMVIVDEVHHAPASTWSGVLDKCPALYRYGLSATPERRDGQDHILGLYFGRELQRVDRGEVLDSGSIVPARVETYRSGCWPDADEWQPMVSALALDEHRSIAIARIASVHIHYGPVLILTDRVQHAEALAFFCETYTSCKAVLVHGKLKNKVRISALALASSCASVTVATTGVLGEGVDVAVWQNLILALPMSGKGSRLTQAIGRVVRPHAGKDEAVIIDVIDDHPMCLGAWRSRRATYKKLGIKIE